jgi:hypothetical protein
LEKLFGVGSFDGFIDHLAHYQAILHISLSKFILPFIFWTIAPTFLGCWVLITLAFVIHSQHDDHPILLDVVTHVEIGISLFQITL